MSARYVSGRLVMEEGGHVDEDDTEREDQMRTVRTRLKFQSLKKQIQQDTESRRMGEFKKNRSRDFVTMQQEGIGIDSDSDLEPEEPISSLTVGMLPEYIFNVCMFLKFCVGFYLFGNGLTVMRWKASVQSFIDPHFDSDYNEGTAPPDHHPILSERKFEGSIIELRYFRLTWVGLIIMSVAILDMVFCLLLWHAVFQYKKHKIVPHSIILILLEVPIIISAWIAHGQLECRIAAVRRSFIGYLKRFGYDRFSTRKIHDLQFKVGTRYYFKHCECPPGARFSKLQKCCCGLTGWKDYEELKNNVNLSWLQEFDTDENYNGTPDPVHFYQQKFQTTVPFTCCKWPWNANLYCAKESTKWFNNTVKYKKKIEERFYQEGCDSKLLTYCERVIAMLSIHLELIYVTYLLLNIIIFLMVYFIMQKINLMKLEAESLYDFNKLEIYDNAFESDDSAEFDKMSDDETGAGGDVKSKITKSLKDIYDEMNRLETTQGGTLEDWDNKGKVAKSYPPIIFNAQNNNNMGDKTSTNQTQTEGPYQSQLETLQSPPDPQTKESISVNIIKEITKNKKPHKHKKGKKHGSKKKRKKKKGKVNDQGRPTPANPSSSNGGIENNQNFVKDKPKRVMNTININSVKKM